MGRWLLILTFLAGVLLLVDVGPRTIQILALQPWPADWLFWLRAAVYLFTLGNGILLALLAFRPHQFANFVRYGPQSLLAGLYLAFAPAVYGLVLVLLGDEQVQQIIFSAVSVIYILAWALKHPRSLQF